MRAIDELVRNRYSRKMLAFLLSEFPALARIPKFTDGGGSWCCKNQWVIQWGDFTASVLIYDKDIEEGHKFPDLFVNYLDEQLIGCIREIYRQASVQLFQEPGEDQNSRSLLQGFPLWCPKERPLDNFNRVDRSKDPTLGGFRLTEDEVIGLSTMERITRLITRMMDQPNIDGVTDVFLSPSRFVEVAGPDAREPITRVICEQFVLITPDKRCPADTGWAMYMPQDGSVIGIQSIAEFPHAVSIDGSHLIEPGNTLREEPAENPVYKEQRGAAYPALYVKYPHCLGRCPLG